MNVILEIIIGLGIFWSGVAIWLYWVHRQDLKDSMCVGNPTKKTGVDVFLRDWYDTELIRNKIKEIKEKIDKRIRPSIDNRKTNDYFMLVFEDIESEEELEKCMSRVEEILYDDIKIREYAYRKTPTHIQCRVVIIDDELNGVEEDEKK